MKLILWVLGVIAMGSTISPAQSPGSVKVALVKNAYSGSREEAELSPGPDALERAGLAEMLAGLGCDVAPPRNARLTAEQEKEYGAWQRMGLANGHLGRIVADSLKEGRFPVGLLANCNGLMGMLAGLQHSGPTTRPLKVGLVWIDAHADFNIPETTLSGMLGGMPVAVAAGLCLTRLRLQSGLDPALPFSYIVMAGVRDVDPLEQELLDRHRIEMIPVADLRRSSQKIHEQMKRLSDLTDLIYIHIDMDVLDPKEVSGHSLTVAGGPASRELAGALTTMFQYKKAAALGIASYPADRDQDKISLRAAYALVEGAIRGIQARQ
ncbi:MAG: arginase family protein [Acidobacteriia bacterium]|nr:arginase family protein [Terriglobia bacterium]